MTRWPTKPLEEIAELYGGSTPSRDRPAFWGGDIYWVTPTDLPMPDEGISVVSKTKDRITQVGLDNSSASVVPKGTVLFSSRATIGKVAIADMPLTTNQGFANFVPHSEVTSRFLAYALWFHREDIARLSGSTTFKEVSRSTLRKYHLPVPPLAEQERIVKLLDEADELRKLRAQADRRTADLIPALFHEMFGDTVDNSKDLPAFPFGELLAEPLRNGLSPAKDGSYPAKVFTLSAITGEEFDGSAWKEASFARLPDENCQVSEHLFLICRGNGNRELVGCGKFPSQLPKGIVFPDTIIAAVPKLDRLVPAFLEAAWEQANTRSQIQASARTTNGTYKINQTAIEQIRLLLPPLPLQREFAARVSDIRAMQAEQATSRRRLDDLFNSMLHRAFQGEL